MRDLVRFAPELTELAAPRTDAPVRIGPEPDDHDSGILAAEKRLDQIEQACRGKDDEEIERLCDEAGALRDAVAVCPARTLAGAAAKLRILSGLDCVSDGKTLLEDALGVIEREAAR